MLSKMDSIQLLMEYLQDVLNYESKLLGLRWSDSTINAQIKQLQQKINKTVLPLEPKYPATPNEKATKTTAIKKTLGIMFVCVVAFFVANFIGAMEASDILNVFMLLVVIGAPIYFIACIVAIIAEIKDNKKFQKKAQSDWEKAQANYTQAKIDYEQALKNYHEKKNATEEEVEKMNEELDLLDSRKVDISKSISENESLLNGLYALDVIHFKYRDITAISSIFDYLSTGRTESLGRRDSDPGAYNIYEDDVRAGKIINAIDMGFNRISNKFDNMGNKIVSSIGDLRSSIENSMVDIKINQQSLYFALDKGNKIMESVTANNADIRKSLSENTGYAKMIADNTEKTSQYYIDKYGIARSRDGWPL